MNSKASRGELIGRGVLSEAIVREEDLRAAEGAWLINSVRGWRRAVLIESAEK